MLEGLAEAIKVAVQWIFAPLLAFAVLAWLCLRIEATGAFDAIRDSVRKMSVFQRFAAAAFLAVFIVFASEKTNSPPANLPSAVLPSVPPQPPRSGASGVTNLCFTGISVSSNGEAQLSLAWPTNFIPTGSVIDIFASTSLVGCAWNWIAGLSVGSGATNWTPTVDTTCLATGTDAYPPMLFFSSAVRADPGDLRDTDGDSIPDAYEIRNGGNPYLPDYDYSSKLAVRPSGSLPTIASALAASRNYSIIELDPSFVHDVASVVHVPAHPVMICSPPGTCAVVRATQFAAFLLDTNVTSRTLFKNLYVLLDARSSYQAAFFVGGNLPWYPIAASATFEDIYVRTPHPGVEHFGWLLYTSAEEPVSLSRCTVNAAGSKWVYGVQDFGTVPLVLDSCSFVNFPSNLTGRSCGILTRSSPSAGGGAEVSVLRTVFDESFTNAIMIGRLENGVSNVISVANCIVPRDLFSSFNLEFVSNIVVTNAALAWSGFPMPESPSVGLGMGALAPVANDPMVDTDGDGLCDYEEIYIRGTDPYLADTDRDGVPDGVEAIDDDTDPADPHSFRQHLYFSVTNTASLSHAAYVAWGYSAAGWETNGLTEFPLGAGTNSYVDASANGAVYIKAFCDLDDDGEFNAAADILLVRPIPQGAVANIGFVFGDVDGDGVTDEQEREDRTDPYSSKNFKFSETWVSYTDVDHGHGYTNIIALSQTPDGWDSNEAVAMFSSATFTNVITATATNGVVYVKCLRDLDGDGELDVGEEQMVVTILTAANNGKVTSVTIGDYDGDGVPDSQEILDGTNPHNAKNFRVRRWMDIATSDPVVSCTNYLAASPSQFGWQPTTVVTSFVCTSASVYIEETATNGFVYVKCLRDFNHDGSYDEADDVLYTVPLAATSSDRYVMGVGDHDSDGVFDSEELVAGTNPNVGAEYCFSLNATVAGIFTPSNGFSAVAYLGDETNVLYGPCVQSNSTLAMNFGHLSTTSRDKVSFLFWEDVNGNGIRDADERKTVCGFRVSGHSMCVTNVLELGDFDADGDGMLDDWEITHGLSPSNAADAIQDADGDGFINLYEYIAGTDPNDAEDNGEGTALYAATHGVDDRIAAVNASVSKPYYSDYHGDGIDVIGDIQDISFAFNTSCWMRGVDMTCLSVWEDSPPGEWRVAFTAITPQHVISARHVALTNGCRMSFQSLSGETVVRTLVAQTYLPSVAENDLWIGLLDSPLPPSIKPARLLPPDYALNIGTGRKLPLVRIGRDKTCNIHDIKLLAPNARYNGMSNLETSQDPIRRIYWRNRFRMDSGHPIFLLFDNDLVFICPTKGYYSDNQATGFLCAYYMSLIQRAVDGLSDQHGIGRMPIAEFDFSQFHEEVGQ